MDMNSQEPGRRPEQQSDGGPQQQPQQQNQQKHHDPRGEDAGNLARQTPTGGTAQDGFGQSGTQGTPDQTEHNARPGKDV
jgi:hypothetical protein